MKPATPSPRRILHVIQNLNYGGMERLLVDLVRGIGEAFESHVLVLQYLGRFSRDLEDIATLHEPPKMTRLSMLWPRTLIDTIKGIEPDVVHTHSGVWYKGALAARRAGVPRVIHTEHGRHLPDPKMARLLDGLASLNTDVVVGVSSAVSNLLANQIVRGHSCRVETVVNGVDTERLRPRSDTGRLRQELGLGHNVSVVGSIGRLESVKDYRTMVDAFGILLQRYRGPHPPRLAVAGDGSEAPALRARIAELDIGDHVHLLGWRDDVMDLLSAFTCFTMSSRSEGTSVSLLEAMSSGLCPVVTDVGGNAAVLGASLAHRLVPPGDPMALARAWEAVLSDEEARKRDACLARARVEQEFSAARMVEHYRQIYDE